MNNSNNNKAVIIGIISILILTASVALPVTISRPQRTLESFAEPDAFKQYLDSCIDKIDNVVDCFLSTVSVSPSSSSSSSPSPSPESESESESESASESAAASKNSVDSITTLLGSKATSSPSLAPFVNLVSAADSLSAAKAKAIATSLQEYQTASDKLIAVKAKTVPTNIVASQTALQAYNTAVSKLKTQLTTAGASATQVNSAASKANLAIQAMSGDQASLIAYCQANLCSPSISVDANVGYYKRPYKPLSPPEYILQIKPSSEIAGLTSDAQQLVNELTKMPGVKIIHSYGSGFAIQVDSKSNPIFQDPRFTAFVSLVAGHVTSSSATATNKTNTTTITATSSTPAAKLDTNATNSTTAALKWNQTLPYGFQRTTSPLPLAANKTGIDADIAILDTGVSLHHPDLNVYRNVSFLTSGTPTGDDDVGHGSHVAGIAAAKDNGIGVVGEAPGARIWSVKVCDKTGECKPSDQIKGIEYVIAHADEIDVLNISIENPNTPPINDAIARATRAGVTVVVSAGNYGQDANSTTPANSKDPGVMTVSAIGDSDGKCGALGPTMEEEDGIVSDDTFAFFSNYGKDIDVAAPGVKVLSSFNGTNYATETGTSMAAPYVAGAAALFKSINPYASPAQVVANITASGSFPDTVCKQGPQGYFQADLDTLNEPLLLRKER